MKYGILFGAASVLLSAAVIIHGGWYVLCVWPAVSFAIVASGYLYFDTAIYGKSSHGVLSTINVVLLLPYLLFLWTVWHSVRWFKRESAYDQLTENIYIGRRLLGHEFPAHFDHVIDLTCEFSEPPPLRSVDYHSFQILDGYVSSTKQFQAWIEETVTLPGTIYIHCAEGHGRTGLFAAALLVRLGQYTTVNEALEFVKSKRPLVRLGLRQMAVLKTFERNNK